MAAGKMYRKFGEFRMWIFEICKRTDRQRKRQTDIKICWSQ